MSGKLPIASQIAEAQRELALRRNTYPRLVATGKMRQAEADLCTERMQAILDTLMFCQKHEADIRAFISAKRASETGSTA